MFQLAAALGAFADQVGHCGTFSGLAFGFGETFEATIYQQYMETLLAVDESVGRLVETLRRKGVLDSTLIIYMGDNGYAWGEHGMTDKRSACEQPLWLQIRLGAFSRPEGRRLN